MSAKRISHNIPCCCACRADNKESCDCNNMLIEAYHDIMNYKDDSGGGVMKKRFTASVIVEENIDVVGGKIVDMGDDAYEVEVCCIETSYRTANGDMIYKTIDDGVYFAFLIERVKDENNPLSFIPDYKPTIGTFVLIIKWNNVNYLNNLKEGGLQC